MKKPIRIQRKRTKGWKMPPNTVCVDRTSKWGNIFRMGLFYQLLPYGFSCSSGNHEGYRWCGDRKTATEMFKEMLGRKTENWEFHPTIDEIKELRGKTLACWCPLDQPCHADVLLEIANADQ